MNLFDQMKKDWRSQQNKSEVDLESIYSKTKQELFSNQRKLIFTNLFISISFAAVFVVLGWVWNSFPDRTLYFYISLASMGVLLFVTMAGIWAGVQFNSETSYKTTIEFLKDYIKKLHIRKFMIEKFVPVYLVLLLFFFYMYYADILAGASLPITISAYGGTTLFIIAVYMISRKKQRYKVNEIDEMIQKLSKWVDELQ